MVEHWVKYVRWEVIERWRQRVLVERGDPTEHFPYAFASGDEAFPRIAGGVLWLVTSPHFGAYRLPPSLVARLEVIDVVRRDSAQAQDLDIEVLRSGGWVALAARRRGAYLPVNNALHTLQQLRFRGRVDRLPGLGMEVAARDHEDREDREEREDGDRLRLYSGIPGRFRRHRVVAAESAPVLEDYAAAVRSGRRVFLSYRWKDFEADPDWVRQVASALSSQRVSCWWDRWDVPQDQPQPLTEPILTAILDDAIHQTAWFVALMRPGYLEPGTAQGSDTWARREWDLAGRHDSQRHRNVMARVAVTFGLAPGAGSWIDATHDQIVTMPQNASPADVANSILELLPPVDA